jgi:hypothetical protein
MGTMMTDPGGFCRPFRALVFSLAGSQGCSRSSFALGFVVSPFQGCLMGECGMDFLGRTCCGPQQGRTAAGRGSYGEGSGRL